MPVIDPKTGEVREAYVFVAVLGASSYTYAEATWTRNFHSTFLLLTASCLMYGYRAALESV